MKIIVRIGNKLCEHEITETEFGLLTAKQVSKLVGDMAELLCIDKMEREFADTMRRLAASRGVQDA